jgi:hypothetical protein
LSYGSLISRTAAASCVFCTFRSYLQPFSARLPAMRDIIRKALQSAPRSGSIFAAEGEQGDL